jgi:outer membrane phospholipase A
MLLAALVALATLRPAPAAEAATPNPTTPEIASEHEPIRFFERYQPSFFLLGKPITKVQISFKVQILRRVPLFFGYTQLMMWDLFAPSAPFRDLNFNPELFYRLKLGEAGDRRNDLDLGVFDHESNGKDGPASRSWNRAYLRYTSTRLLPERGLWWSLKLAVPYGMNDEDSKQLPKRRGIWELRIGASDLFKTLFEVNEVVLRLYGGGGSRVNPLQGGQELTYREKSSSRKLLLPLYLQIFHGYGENLLDADEKRWGFRAGVGF